MPVRAGIPVVDVMGNIQAVIEAITSVVNLAVSGVDLAIQSITLKNLLKAEETAEDSLEIEKENIVRPENSLWSNVKPVSDEATQQIKDLDYHKNYAASFAEYLGIYKDLPTYQALPCYSATGCSDDAQYNLWVESKYKHSAAIKEVNDTSVWRMTEAFNQISIDADYLKDQIDMADLAEGHLEAIYSTNVLAAELASQMLSLRTAVTSAIYAETIRSQTAVDKQAQQDAAAYQLRGGFFINSTPVAW